MSARYDDKAARSAPAPLGADLETLAAAAKSCTACPIHAHATQTVFGKGPETARIVLIGEQPGDQEDIAGEPFVGPAGKLLRQILAEVGIEPDGVYVTNAVKHFKWEPRGKRRLHQKPTSREMAACRPWLAAELARIQPPIVICLGATAAQSLLGAAFRLTRERGVPQPTSWAPWTMATLHPSALLRMPDAASRHLARQQFTEDMAKAAAELARWRAQPSPKRRGRKDMVDHP